MTNHRFFEDKIESLRCADGVERPVHIWEANEPKGVLLAVHGALAHGGDYCHMAKWFNQRGWTMFSIDQRGHDLKHKVHINRFEEFLDDLALLIDWSKSNYPGLPLFIVGHSMGGLVTAHYALRRESPEDQIRGYILSAPYWANAVPISPILKSLSFLLSILLPKLTAPAEDFLDVLTHDDEITARHKRDEADDIRARSASCRFIAELFSAHKFIDKQIHEWNSPLFVAIAGQDHLTDSDQVLELLKRIKNGPVEQNFYSDNYHENFNELNREEIFSSIELWLAKQLSGGA